MKYLYLIFIVIVIQGCIATNKHSSILRVSNNVDSLLTEKVNDLRVNGVDTILKYFISCSGCIENTPKSGYIIWKEKGIVKSIKIDSYLQYQDTVKLNDVFQFYSQEEESIKNQNLNSSKYELLHYKYVKIDLLLGKQVFTKEVSNDLRIKENNNNLLMIWIKDIESNLFLASQQHWRY